MGVAVEETARIFSVPLYPGLSDADLDDVLAALHRIAHHYRA